MLAASNSAMVWKRAADENLQSARMFARAAAVLLALCLAAGAYAYSSNARYADLCGAVAVKSQLAAAPAAKKLGESILDSYCS